MKRTTTVEGSTPYPWPWDGVLDDDRMALVLTGWDSHWAAAATPSAAVLANIVALTAAIPTVVLVGHVPPRRSTVGGVPPSPAGALAAVRAAATRLLAQGIDAFHDSGLDSVLRRTGIDTIVLAGLGLETTVHSTMRSANDRGLECLLVVDACAPLDPHLVPQSVSMIEMSGGIFGAVGTTAAVRDALATSAPVPTP